jgi:hypothetical protein
MSVFMHDYEFLLAYYTQNVGIVDYSQSWDSAGWFNADTYYSGSVIKGFYRSSGDYLYNIDSFMVAKGYWTDTGVE